MGYKSTHRKELDSVYLLTPYILAIFAYVNFSSSSSDLIDASASSIAPILMEL